RVGTDSGCTAALWPPRKWAALCMFIVMASGRAPPSPSNFLWNHKMIIMKKTDASSNRRVLVIDDNPAIHEDFRKILSPPGALESSLSEREAALFGLAPLPEALLGCELDSAFQGQEGLQRVERARAEQRPYAVAFVDV